MLQDPGIILHIIVTGLLSASVALPSDLVIALSTEQAEVVAESEDFASYWTANHPHVVKVPSATELPGYPVDPTEALVVPDEPTEYVRTITIDGIVVHEQTITLNPEDVRASIDTVTINLDDFWFEFGDMNRDGATNFDDWIVVRENWQQDVNGRTMDVVALQNVLRRYTPPAPEPLPAGEIAPESGEINETTTDMEPIERAPIDHNATSSQPLIPLTNSTD